VLIEADGWRQVRQAGSHRHYRHPTKPGTAVQHLSGHEPKGNRLRGSREADGTYCRARR